MRIIQLIQKKQRRGAEIFAVQLAGELISFGQVVRVISLFSSSEQIFSMNVHSLERTTNNRFWDLKGWKKLAEQIDIFKPDIIQANAADTLKFSVFSKLIFRWEVPIIYRNANQMGDFIRNPFQKWLNQFLLNQVNGIISVSKASQQDLVETFDLMDFPHQVIPIGIDPIQIKLQSESNLKIELPEFFILQVGGLVPEKDPLGTVALFQKLTVINSDLSLIFLGSGPLEKILLKEINDKGLSGKVQIIPNQTNIFPILRRARVLIMPSKIEGLPGVVLEAMYCQIPVVAYGVGGIPEVLKTGETGWCIRPKDSQAFVQAIKQVITMPEEAKQKILDQAHQLVTIHYSLPQVSFQFEQFYKSLLKQN